MDRFKVFRVDYSAYVLSVLDIGGLLPLKNASLVDNPLERDMSALSQDLHVLSSDYSTACDRVQKEIVEEIHGQ